MDKQECDENELKHVQLACINEAPWLTRKIKKTNIMCHKITIELLEKSLNTYALPGPSDS